MTMITAIVLAAGESSRMGRPKALLPLAGETFLAAVCGRLRRSGIDDIVVVLGAVAGAVRAGWSDPEARVVVNPVSRGGQISSLRCGLRAVRPESPAALVALVDHPLVRAETYEGLRLAWEAEPDRIWAASYRGRGGHPVVFPRSVFGELLSGEGEGGARAVMRRDPARVRRAGFDDPGIVADIDTPEEYARFVAAEGGAGEEGKRRNGG